MTQEPRIGQLWSIVLAAGEGTRVRSFLSQLCGGRGIKQFCAIMGRRSMLEHTLERVEWLIPRQRTLIIVSHDHRQEAARQLAHWSSENIIFQPENRDTAAGILLPLAHIAHRDPLATVAIFPSDHFILEEWKFMQAVRHAVWETQGFPWGLTLLGIEPDKVEDGYGWIEPAAEEENRTTRAVLRFWEKPTQKQAQVLWRRGALWNSFVCVVQCGTLWGMARQAVPDIYEDFKPIRQALGKPQAELVTKKVYAKLRAVNFCSGICEPCASALRVLPVSGTGWSDWGSVDRILETAEQLGKKAELLARLNHDRRTWNHLLLQA